MRVKYIARSGGVRDIFFIFFNMKVCCVFSLESPHRGDSNEYTQHTTINIKKKITLTYLKYNNLCSYWDFFLGTKGRVSHGKRAIGVRAIEVLLYYKSAPRGTGCFLLQLIPTEKGDKNSQDDSSESIPTHLNTV